MGTIDQKRGKCEAEGPANGIDWISRKMAQLFEKKSFKKKNGRRSSFLTQHDHSVPYAKYVHVAFQLALFLRQWTHSGVFCDP